MSQRAVVLTACLNTYGSVSYPATPHTVHEIIASAVDANASGAAVAHIHGLHGMDEQGRATKPDLRAWQAIVEGIRRQCEMVVQFGVTVMDEADRLSVLDTARPDMMAVTLGDVHGIVEGKELYARHDRGELASLLARLREYGVTPELEVFNEGAIWNARWLIEKRLLRPRSDFLFFTLPVAFPGGIHSPANLHSLAYRSSLLPHDSEWQGICFVEPKGTATPAEQWRILAGSVALGGHTRVGVEDSPYFADGADAGSNAELVERLAWIVRNLGHRPAEAGELRARLSFR